MNRSGITRRLAAVLLTVGMCASVMAQPPGRPALDPLAEARARQQIADQKAEADVKNAIADADRIAKTNPAKALQTLKGTQVNSIDLAAAISGDARKSLTDALDRKIASIQGKALPNPGPALDPKAVALKDDKRAAFESQLAEVKDIRAGVDRFAQLKKAGLNKDADYELAKLTKAYPNNPSVLRLQDQDTIANRVEDSLEFARQQNERITLVMRDVDKSTLPAKGDIEFPKDWAEKTKRRSKDVELTETEKKIIESLNKAVTVNWNGRPLDEALQDLSNTLDQKLFIDKQSIENLGVDLRKPINLQANGVSARTVLRQLLASQGLTFVVRDQVIQVVDTEKAKNLLVTKVYYLGDIVQGVGPFGGALRWGPYLDMQQTLANVDAITQSIKSSIDPLCWKENGGPCTITFHFPSMSIIVRASAEVQASLGAKVGGGK